LQLADRWTLAAAVPTGADDPMLLYFTSGMVAYPKMVLHTQASLGIGHQLTARFWQDLKPADLHWTVSAFGWAKAAWGKLFGQWALGAANFLWDVRGKPDFDHMLRLIGEHAVIGKPDPQRGQIVKAYVVLAPGHQGSDTLVGELQEHCLCERELHRSG
jgi:acyl-coenzyme A synthetase/AMP-(fatty) acid ligase